MNLVTVSWSGIAAACLTLALVHLVVWLKHHSDRAYLLFSLVALAVAGTAVGELLMMRAQTPAEFGQVIRWTHVPLFVLNTSLVGFVLVYLDSGRKWLAWLVVGLRLLVLIVNFLSWPNLNYREITAVQPFMMFGVEKVSVAVGTVSPWSRVGAFSSLLLLLFVVDATISLLRRANDTQRRRAILVGGSLSLFIMVAVGHPILVHEGIIRTPYLISVPFLVPLLVMALELSTDVARTARAERDAARQRIELAHLSRVAILGELSGSLAHELNQPLTAILTNAQAAQRFLARDPAETQEIKDILQDIIDADNRAGQIIHKLRALFKKGEVQMQSTDLNGLVHEVLRFLHGDLINHMVRVDTELASNLPHVQVDRIQIQQVLINLIVNACDAMQETAPDERKLLVRTENGNGSGIGVMIRDSGTGIEPDRLERVFEPFETSKGHGMGLGLSVCRTIILAHHGQLWASNNPDRGASFQFNIPVKFRAEN